MLNMERMVGTITPKNVFSRRGSLLGVPEPPPSGESDSMPHATALAARPHTPEVIRGVCSLDMFGARSLGGQSVNDKIGSLKDSSKKEVELRY